LLDLYDPDRSQRCLNRGETRQFAAFLAKLPGQCFADKKASGGAGLYILSDTVTSPTLAAQWKAAQQRYPNAKWLQWDPVNRDSAYSASKTAFGGYYDAQYRLQGCRRHRLSRRGLSLWHHLPRISAFGGGLRWAAQAIRRQLGHEPAVCH